MAEDEIAGQRRERIAAIGVGRGGEIVGNQPQLALRWDW